MPTSQGLTQVRLTRRSEQNWAGRSLTKPASPIHFHLSTIRLYYTNETKSFGSPLTFSPSLLDPFLLPHRFPFHSTQISLSFHEIPSLSLRSHPSPSPWNTAWSFFLKYVCVWNASDVGISQILSSAYFPFLSTYFPPPLYSRSPVSLRTFPLPQLWRIFV